MGVRKKKKKINIKCSRKGEAFCFDPQCPFRKNMYKEMYRQIMS